MFMLDLISKNKDTLKTWFADLSSNISISSNVIRLAAVVSPVASAAVTAAQISPAGLTVIQSPAGVYYALYCDSKQPNRARFYYLNYGTQEFDVIAPNVSASGAFSGTSQSTGRTLTGQISSTSISLTYNFVTKSGPKESLYGPTLKYAGTWLGTSSDANVGTGFAEFFVSSNDQCLVFALQDFTSAIGIGTIDSNGNVVVPLLSGDTISGNFAPANGGAAGTLTHSPSGAVDTYELTNAVTPRLFNISTRGLVGTGDQVLIGGFIISGGGKTVLITAKGPSLAAFGVTNPVQNPRLDVYNMGGQVIASNANWKSNSNAAEIMASGFAPSDDREAALQLDLEPGAYTAIVSSEDGTTGVGLVEVFGVGSAVGR